MLELVFAGSALQPRFPTYERMQPSMEAAAREAARVYRVIDPTNWDQARARWPAMVYGPGCGRNGLPVGDAP